MKIATILFTYNRSEHTRAVLEGLAHSTIMPQKLFIFHDGPKENTNIQEWENVEKVIHSVTWCDVEIHTAKENKGLANSVIDGVNLVMKTYDAVIVLEDDCVPHKMFMEYMQDALWKYADDKRVYSVGGWAWPLELEASETDAYFTGRISSCGWGTWRDRWSQYERDYSLLNRIKKNKEMNERLQIWGYDLESHLVGNITGTCDSWAVFWALKVIEKGGYCLAPYESLITNIGFDGTGVHSGIGGVCLRQRDEENMKEVVLPDNVIATKECKIKFAESRRFVATEEKLRCYNKIFSDWLELRNNQKSILNYFSNRGINKISVWGRGKICEHVLKELNGQVEILSIIESNPKTDRYHNIPVVALQEIPKETQLIVIIPVYDINVIQDKIKNQTGIECIGIDQIIEMSNT